MEVRDDDLRAVHAVEHVGWNEFAVGVVAVRVVRLENPETVFNRQAGSADQKSSREMFAGRTAHGVDGLPGYQHGHDGGLARAGGELQGEAHEFRICVLARRRKVVKKAFARFGLWANLGQPNDRLGCLDLAKERADARETVVPPVLKEARRLGRDLPLTLIGQGAPLIYVPAQLVDDRSRVILLVLRGKPFSFVEDDFLLFTRSFAFLGLGNGGDELGPAAIFDDFLSGLTLGVQLPMPQRKAIRRVEDRSFEKGVRHFPRSCSRRHGLHAIRGH